MSADTVAENELDCAMYECAALPEFFGVIEVKHNIAGRLRLKVALLRGGGSVIQGLKSALMKLEGVDAVEVSEVTGSLLILYSPQKLNAMILMTAVIKLLGLEDKILRPRSAWLSKELAALKDSLDWSIFAKSRGALDLGSFVTLGLIGLTGYGLLTGKRVIFPGTITTLWWSYQSFSRKSM